MLCFSPEQVLSLLSSCISEVACVLQITYWYEAVLVTLKKLHTGEKLYIIPYKNCTESVKHTSLNVLCIASSKASHKKQLNLKILFLQMGQVIKPHFIWNYTVCPLILIQLWWNLFNLLYTGSLFMLEEFICHYRDVKSFCPFYSIFDG